MARLSGDLKFGVGIRGMGYYVPEKVVTNLDLMKTLDTSDEWIKEKIGVTERRWAAEHENLVDLAVNAGAMAIENSGLKPEDIDLVILSRVMPDHLDPATACNVQYRLGAVNAGAFDVVAGGCPGSVYSLAVGANFIASGSFKNVLVLCGDIVSRSVLDYQDRASCCFFGDGAGAAVLSRVPLGKGMQTYTLNADGAKYSTCIVRGGGLEMPLSIDNIHDRGTKYLRMNNGAVWQFANTVFPESVRSVTEEAGYQIKDLDLVIPHQANINIIKNSMNSLGLDMSKTHTTIEKYGNTSGASVLITLCDALEKGKVKENDNVALVSFGAGLAWAAMFMKWTSKEDFAA